MPDWITDAEQYCKDTEGDLDAQFHNALARCVQVARAACEYVERSLDVDAWDELRKAVDGEEI